MDSGEYHSRRVVDATTKAPASATGEKSNIVNNEKKTINALSTPSKLERRGANTEQRSEQSAAEMSPRMPPIEFSSGAVVVGEGGEGSEPLMVNRKKGFDDNRARLTANDLIYSPNNLMARLLETHESTTLFRHPEPPSVLSSTTPVAALDRVFSAVSQETDEDLELKSTTAAYVIYPGTAQQEGWTGCDGIWNLVFNLSCLL